MKTAEDILNEKGSEILSVAPDVTIQEALQLMSERKIGAILIKDNDEYVGIWTERDLMHNTLDTSFDVAKAPIGDYMTRELKSAPHDAPLYSLADKFLGLRLRHLLIEREGQFIGLLSSGDVLRASLQERTEQLQELNSIVHLEYYDQWRWAKRKK